MNVIHKNIVERMSRIYSSGLKTNTNVIGFEKSFINF